MTKSRTLRVAGTVAALAARRRRRRRWDHRHGRRGQGPAERDQDQGQRPSALRCAGGSPRRGRPADREQDGPGQDRPAYLLARREGRRCRRARTSSSGARRSRMSARTSSTPTRSFFETFSVGEPNRRKRRARLGRHVRRRFSGGRFLVHGRAGRDHEPHCGDPQHHAVPVHRPPGHAGQGQGHTAQVGHDRPADKQLARGPAPWAPVLSRCWPARARRRWPCRSRPRLPGFGPPPRWPTRRKPFQTRLPVPEVLTAAEIELDMVEAEVRHPPRRADRDVDLRRHVPRSDDPPPGRRGHRRSPSTTSCRARPAS